MTRLAKALKEKRGRRSFVAVSKETNIELERYCDIEDEIETPLITEYIKICAWLGVDPKEYLDDYK